MYMIYFLSPNTKMKAHKQVTTYVYMCSVGMRLEAPMCAYSMPFLLL